MRGWRRDEEKEKKKIILKPSALWYGMEEVRGERRILLLAMVYYTVT